MKMGEVLKFFGDQLEKQNFKQWDFPISFDNIPANIIDRAYHITIGKASSGPAVNQVMHEFKMPVTVRLFFKGYREPLDAMVAALNEGETVLGALLAPALRLEQTTLRDVRPVSVQPFVLSSTNDNSIILELAFETILQYRFS